MMNGDAQGSSWGFPHLGVAMPIPLIKRGPKIGTVMEPF